MNEIKYLIIILSLFLITKNVYAEEHKYTNKNTDYEVIIEDDASLLTEEEIELLKKDMYALTEYGYVLFKTTEVNSHISTGSFAESYYHNKIGKSSGTLFLIDMKYRNIYIFSDGQNNRIITKSKAYIITDNIYKYASNGEYYKCAKEAFKEINTLLKGGKILEPMRYISNGVISVILSSFITFFIAIGTTKLKTAKNKELIKNCNVNFEVSDIKVIKTGKHSSYSPRNDSDSGFGSSGGFSGGGGGGSSGSGGGHSF